MSAPDGPKPSLDASIGALCVPSPPRPHSLAPELTLSYVTASCASRQLLVQPLAGSDSFCNSGTVFSCFLAGVTFTQTLTYFSNFYRVDHLVLIVMTIALKTIGMAHTAICWCVLASSSDSLARSPKLTPRSRLQPLCLRACALPATLWRPSRDLEAPADLDCQRVRQLCRPRARAGAVRLGVRPPPPLLPLRDYTN